MSDVSNMSNDLYLGIDLGTSSVKLTVIDGTGKPVESAQADYDILRPLIYSGVKGSEDKEKAEGYEERPGDWMTAICKALGSMKEETRRSVRGISFSSQMPTLVVSSPDGTPLRNAILWCDNRAEAQGRMLLEGAGRKEHFTRTGVMLDGRYLAPMYMWLAENEPDILNNDHYILSAGDWLYLKFTGLAATNPSLASGYGIYNISRGAWDESLMAITGIRSYMLPEVWPSHSAPGSLRRETAQILGLTAGIPVRLGAADSVAAVYGTGAADAGDVCAMCGSSTAMIAVTGRDASDEFRGFFITPLTDEGAFGLEADILSSGKTIDWLRTLFGVSYDKLFDMIEKAAPDFGGVLATPYLMGGEQGVLWDSSLRAGVFGLNSSHGPGDIAGAFVFGVCCEMRRCLEAFSQVQTINRIVLSGPAAGNRVFMQMLADITGRTCICSSVADASARGAAYIAAGIRSEADNEQAYIPGENRAAYDRHYREYIKVSAGSKQKGE